jgi:hypothetical protein
MSGGGGDSGGSDKGSSGKGGASNTGFENPASPQGVTAQSGSQIAASPAASPAGFSLGGTLSPGDTSFGAGNSGGGVSTSPTSSLTSPLGITGAAAPSATAAISAPAGIGGAPSDLASSFDPLNPNQAQGGIVPNQSTALSPQQLGQSAATTTAPTAAAPAAAAPAAAGDKSVLDSLGIKNPLGAAIAAGGVGYSVLNGQKQDKYAADAAAQANALNAQGQQLLSYLQSGNLPPGLQASLTQATSAAKAKIISNFASQGLNTDPAQNSALASELAAVDQQALISTAQIGQQLMTSGIQETGLSSGLYTTLAGIDQTQTAAIGKSIANFASALSGGGGGINIKLPGS